MNKRFISVLIFAFVVAAGASVTVYRLLVGRIRLESTAPKTKILVASRNIDAGTILSGRDFDEAPWAATIPDGAFTKAADLTGRAAATPIYESEPITEKRLGPKGSGGGLAATIPTGMRAVAVRVNDVAGVAGFVVAGTHVDVIVSSGGSGAAGGGGGFSLGSHFGVSLPSISIPTISSASGGESDNATTRTLLQNILVLSAGQEFKKDAEGKPVNVQVVNLLVTPLQAEMLSLASNQLTMQLVLRNPVDAGYAETHGVTMANLYKLQDIVPAMANPQVKKPSAFPPEPDSIPARQEGTPNQPANSAAKMIPASYPSDRPAKAAKPKTVAPTPAPRPAPRMEIIEGNRRTEVELQIAEAR